MEEVLDGRGITKRVQSGIVGTGTVLNKP